MQDRFEAETLWNYETSFRGWFAEGRATVAANLFFNDMRDAQRPLTVEIPLPNGSSFFATEFANAPVAESHRLEVEAAWKPTGRLSTPALP
jgi:outer membrane receptor protein involved in Fe transport